MKTVYTRRQRISDGTHKFHDCKYDERSRNGSWITSSRLGYKSYYLGRKYYVQKGTRRVKNPREPIRTKSTGFIPVSNIPSKVSIVNRTSDKNTGNKNYKKFN